MVKHISDDARATYETLLLEYAAGLLDQAQNLIIAAHLAYSSAARDIVHECENIGAALLERECAPVRMREQSLQNVLSRLDEPCEPDCDTLGECDSFLADLDIPAPLRAIILQQSRRIRWRTLAPGLQATALRMDSPSSHISLMKARPAFRTPAHTHTGLEITLVLDGALMDESGQYRRGDLIVFDEGQDHAQMACENRGCVCVRVSATPIRFKGFLGLVNPFMRS